MLASLASLTGPQCLQRTKAQKLYFLVVIAVRNPEHFKPQVKCVSSLAAKLTASNIVTENSYLKWRSFAKRIN